MTRLTHELKRDKNKTYRSREYLTIDEVETLLYVAKTGRKFSVRNHALILMMFRHGLRAGEVGELRWDAVLWGEKRINITRIKRGIDGVHNLEDDEIEVLKQLKKESKSSYIFASERGVPLSNAAVAQLVKRIGKIADLGFPVHAHQLRHACGYHMAKQGIPLYDIKNHLGHQKVESTMVYINLVGMKPGTVNWNRLED